MQNVPNVLLKTTFALIGLTHLFLHEISVTIAFLPSSCFKYGVISTDTVLM